MFDLVDETLHQMPLPVETGIVVAVIDPVLATGNDGNSASGFNEFEHMIGVISSISDDEVTVMISKQFNHLSYVVSLPASQHDGERIAQGINTYVDLGAESASAATQSLGLLTAVFFNAPAAQG